MSCRDSTDGRCFAIGRDLLAPWAPLENPLLELEDPAPDAICSSFVAASELRFGAQRKGSAPLTQRVELLLQALDVLPLDTPADEHYADIRAMLERSGTPIESHDLFIAAHARSRGMTLLTRKLRELQRVPGLTVEDWASGAARSRGTRVNTTRSVRIPALRTARP
jgi:tRNA(fMet)-specific endonuclease VapC